MEQLKFSIRIEASKETVWNILFTDENYHKWAKVFSEGSNAKTDWKEGSDVEFTTPNGDGMFSHIEMKEQNRRMVFLHLGMMKDGKRLEDQKFREWADARETYELEEFEGNTTLYVFMDTIKEYEDYFNKTFPKALQEIKELAEQS